MKPLQPKIFKNTVMKTIKFLSILLLAIPAFTNAQFLGGTGRGDYSASFSDGGNCLWFNGSGQYAEAPAASIPTSGDFTVSVWANHDASQTGVYAEILSKGTSGNAFYIGLNANGTLRIGDNWNLTGYTFPTYNLWHNYTVVRTAANTWFYLDNVLTLTKGSAINNPESTKFWVSHQYGGISENFKGGIDEIQIWSRALTACEISANYNMSLTGAEQNLVHYYNFNQSSGNSLTELVSANNGTLYNSPGWTLSGAGVGGTFDLAVTTTGSSNIGLTTATVSGNVTSGTATESGVVYNTSGCPIITGSKVIQTVSSGVFSANLAGVTSGTKYYARAYATDANGTSYGDEVSITTLSPVEVTATAGTAGPTGYATLKTAFDAINLGTHQGVITMKLYASTSEIASAVLNASASPSSYTSVNIYPMASGLSISGAIDGPLVDLNGADYVTIDGRVNATGSAKDLILMNTSVSTIAGTSTVRFISDASNNIIRYCTLKGSTMVGNGGVVCFQNNMGTNGNDDNTIDHNIITSSSDSARPTAAVACVWMTGSTAICDRITISNNMIYDFLQPESNYSRGHNISQGANSWTITGNSFYETTSYSPTTNNTNFIIFVNTGANHTISSNCIGGSSPLCGGTWTKTASANNAFYGIYLNSGKTGVEIQGNTIKNISWANTGNFTWRGIYLQGTCAVNIGTTLQNVIGEAAGNGSITLTAGASGATFYGIYLSNTGTTTVANTTIGSITALNTSATDATNICGIYKTGAGTLSLSSNTIGSTDGATSNSIYATSTATGNEQRVYGTNSAGTRTVSVSGNTISKLTNGTTNTNTATLGLINGLFISSGTNTVENNIIRDLTIANANTTGAYTSSAGGLIFNVGTAVIQTISDNSIYNLSNSNATFGGNVIGLYYNGSNTASSVSGNFIHSLSTSSSSTNASLYGICFNEGNTTFSNNIISLGGGITNGNAFYGIKNAGCGTNANLLFNTVDIEGAASGETANTYALSNGGAVTRDYRNNIFTNARSGGSTGKHYAISLSSVSSLTIDYNDYYAPNGVLGYLGGDITTLSSWKTAPGMDAHSVAANPHFAVAGGTSAADFLPSTISLIATAGIGVTADYAGTTRTYPAMGAWEYPVGPSSVEVTASAGDIGPTGYFTLKAAFDKINNGNHQGAITIKILGSTTETASAMLNASGSGSASYSSINMYPTISGLSISGNISGPLIDLNGADQVTIDGRVNGTGSAKDLTITNTNADSDHTSSSTIRFINDATGNTVKYCTIKGSTVDNFAGVVFFSSNGATTGNDGNTIDHNDITNAADASRPVNAIYSKATTGYDNSFIHWYLYSYCYRSQRM